MDQRPLVLFLLIAALPAWAAPTVQEGRARLRVGDIAGAKDFLITWAWSSRAGYEARRMMVLAGVAP